MPGAMLWAQMETTPKRKVVQRLVREGPASYKEVFSHDLVSHPPLPTPGPDGMRALQQKYASAFADLQVFIEYQFEDSQDHDRVVTVWRLTGKHVGDLETPLGPLKATNKPIDLQLITVARFADNKIVERWGQV